MREESSVQRCIRTVFSLAEWDFLADQPRFVDALAKVESMEQAESVISLGETLLSGRRAPE